MIRYTIIILTVFLLGFTACDTNRVYEQNIEFDDKIWIADSTINFNFDIKDAKQQYNIYYNLRNSVSYPFQNIYINYTLEDTLGNQLSSELVNKNLFHPKTGKPYGDGLGDIFDHQFLLLEDYQFNREGAYRIKMQQFMRKDSLPEIMAVGVRVEKILKED